MIASILLACLAPLTATAPIHPSPVRLRVSLEDPTETFEQRFIAAADDVEALWDLYLWADAYGLERQVRRCLRKIVQVDPLHRQAHEALGHIFYAGRWFRSERHLAKFKQEEERRIAREQGLVEYEGEWVAEADLPFLREGLVRDDDGRWIGREELEKLRAGWRRQDLLWIPPEETEQIDQGLWKCGEDWLSLEEADRYHDEIGRWWRIPTDHFVLHATTRREVAQEAVDLLYKAAQDLWRVVGELPGDQVGVVLLHSPAQYQEVLSGDSILGEVASHRLGFEHHAFLADRWFDPDEGRYPGAGIAYWDESSDVGERFGAHALRHAASQSLLEALDPSPEHLASTLGSRRRGFDAEAFYAEKRFPEWFRYGAAVYVERYFIDATVPHDGNPFWTREWSVQNIVSRGGMRPVPEIFSEPLDGGEAVDAGKLLNERGLVVAFMVDGEVPALQEAHAELRAKIQAGEDLEKAFARIEQLVAQNEQRLREFADL